jgi:hypothetical protein
VRDSSLSASLGEYAKEFVEGRAASAPTTLLGEEAYLHQSAAAVRENRKEAEGLADNYALPSAEIRMAIVALKDRRLQLSAPQHVQLGA